mgnify:CR=1 FL=1
MSNEHYPRIHQFTVGEIVGELPADPTRAAIVKRTLRSAAGPEGVEEQSDPIFGVIENHGEAAFTFSAQESTDNGDADPYGGVNLRVGGANVADVTVAPKARVAFAVEAAAEAYLRFDATVSAAPAVGGVGRLTLCHFFGSLDRKELNGVP